MDSKVANKNIVIGVLALQGAFLEHIILLEKATQKLASTRNFTIKEVRKAIELESCDALIIPGGESTSISLLAQRSGLLDSLRYFVKIAKKPTWGTCAGLILLADKVKNVKEGGQELIGGLGVQVNRNYFGRQLESFETDLDLSFLTHPKDKDCSVQQYSLQESDSPTFRAIFIRAPIVESVLSISTSHQQQLESPVEILGRLQVGTAAENGLHEDRFSKTKPDRSSGRGEIVAVRQANIFGTSFHPELTGDDRIHKWWLEQVLMRIDN